MDINQPIQDNPPENTPQNHTNTKTIFLVLGGIILLILVGAGSFVLGQNSGKEGTMAEITPTVSKMTESTAAENVTSTLAPTIPVPTMINLKTYTNDEIPFTMQYPEDWKVSEQTNPQTNKIYAVRFENKVGSIYMVWGDGFGDPQCSSQPTIHLKNEDIMACQYTLNGMDAYQIDKDISKDFSLVIRVTMNDPLGKDQIMQILSTLKIGK
jgi:hypothetical protein